jgi:hypothetical protein
MLCAKEEATTAAGHPQIPQHWPAQQQQPAITLSTQQNKMVKSVQGVVLRERGKGKMAMYVKGPQASISDPAIREVDIKFVAESTWCETIGEVTVKGRAEKRKITVEWEDHGKGLVGIIRRVPLTKKGKNGIYEATIALPNWKRQGVRGGIPGHNVTTLVNVTAVTSPPRPGSPEQASWAPGHMALGISTKTAIDAALRSNRLPNMNGEPLSNARIDHRHSADQVVKEMLVPNNISRFPEQRACAAIEADNNVQEYDDWAEDKHSTASVAQHLSEIPEHMMQGETPPSPPLSPLASLSPPPLLLSPPHLSPPFLSYDARVCAVDNP